MSLGLLLPTTIEEDKGVEQHGTCLGKIVSNDDLIWLKKDLSKDLSRLSLHVVVVKERREGILRIKKITPLLVAALAIVLFCTTVPKAGRCRNLCLLGQERNTLNLKIKSREMKRGRRIWK